MDLRGKKYEWRVCSVMLWSQCLIGKAVRLIYPRIEPELARIGDYVPSGRTAVDVGGWFGPWSARLRCVAGTVVTVEAVPDLVRLLERSSTPHHKVVHGAASDACGEIDLWIPAEGLFAGTTSVERKAGPPIRVPRITIDSLALKNVGFIKLDIEGHELKALYGAQETIERDWPTVLVELEERHAPIQPVFALLEGWGYSARILREGRWVPITPQELIARQKETSYQLERRLLSRALVPGRRYINLVLFTHGTANV